MSAESHVSGGVSWYLGAALIALMCTASVVGIVAPQVYNDNLLVRSGWYGNDVVTLLLVVPLMCTALHRARAMADRWFLMWLGGAAYALYNFAFYLFGAAFNALFVVYAAVVALSSFTLIVGVASHRMRRLALHAVTGGTDRTVATFLILVATLLGAFWMVMSLSFLVTGAPPPMVTATDHPTNVTGALDLWMVVSFGIMGGILLWRRNSWGYVISTIWSIKGALYMTALSAATVVAFRRGGTDNIAQLALWVPIGAGCAICATALLRSCRTPQRLNRA